MTIRILVPAALALIAAPAFAQDAPSPAAAAAPAPAASSAVVLPASTLVVVTPAAEISSKKIREGDQVALSVVNDVMQDGVVMIPRGAPVKATVTWRTGKGIGGKSAKFELTFNSVRVGDRDWALRGSHRQEGKGNTLAAVLVFPGFSGKSAVMRNGQLVNAFTAEPIEAAR